MSTLANKNPYGMPLDVRGQGRPQRSALPMRKRTGLAGNPLLEAGTGTLGTAASPLAAPLH